MGHDDFLHRIYLYDQILKAFTLVENVSYHCCCILLVSCTVLSFANNELVLLISAATDGQLVLWDMSSLLEHWFHTQSSEEPALCSQFLNPLTSINVHQSGINDFAVCINKLSSTENILLVASIGDDTAVSLTQFCVSFDGQLTVMKQATLPNAHYSAGIGMW